MLSKHSRFLEAELSMLKVTLVIGMLWALTVFAEPNLEFENCKLSERQCQQVTDGLSVLQALNPVNQADSKLLVETPISHRVQGKLR